MEEILEIMKTDLEKYPEMTPQDYFKLIYQNELGPGHLAENEAEALNNLLAEWNEIEADENAELLEPIGNHLCRINLKKAKCLYTPEEINDIFVRTANIHRGRMGEFMHNMKLLKHNLQNLPVHFTEEEFLEFQEMYRGRGYPPLRHSPKYREAYDPHYRVVYEGFAESLDLDC
jgi:hypothetical protein